MKSLNKFIATGIFKLSLLISKEPNETHKLDIDKKIYYVTRLNFVSYYKVFDSKIKQWILFKDYKCDNKLDAIVYNDNDGLEIDMEREYFDLSKWELMFNEVLKQKEKGKIIGERNLAEFLRKHYYK